MEPCLPWEQNAHTGRWCDHNMREGEPCHQGKWNPLSSKTCLVTIMLMSVIADTGVCMGSGRIENPQGFIGENRQGKNWNTRLHVLKSLLNQNRSWDKQVPVGLILGGVSYTGCANDLVCCWLQVLSGADGRASTLCTTRLWDRVSLS